MQTPIASPTPDTESAPHPDVLQGADPYRPLDAVLINAPLRDYTDRPRVNDFPLPVLGMAYIATTAKHAGHNIAVLDAEAHGLPVQDVVALVNQAAPRWAGFNLLAPTYEISATVADRLDSGIAVMVGGHHAKALPAQILTDPRMRNCQALVLGEAETRVTALLDDHHTREDLPAVMWLDPITGQPTTGRSIDPQAGRHLAPDIETMPLVDRTFLAQDPYPAAGRLEANMVGARGCPYDCSFCGAAVSANRDITIRTRRPASIMQEMIRLRDEQQVTAFRFVDDLFLGARRIIEHTILVFTGQGIGEWAVWDATGRINVLDRLPDTQLQALAAAGLREVALGIESGSARILKHIDKRITPTMARDVVTRLTRIGIDVKAYFILGLPTETRADLTLIRELWKVTDPLPGRFRISAFEFRPYPGTPE